MIFFICFPANVDGNKQCKIARGKQKETILELVHNSAQYSTTYFTVQVKSLPPKTYKPSSNYNKNAPTLCIHFLRGPL